MVLYIIFFIGHNQDTNLLIYKTFRGRFTWGMWQTAYKMLWRSLFHPGWTWAFTVKCATIYNCKRSIYWLTTGPRGPRLMWCRSGVGPMGPIKPLGPGGPGGPVCPEIPGGPSGPGSPKGLHTILEDEEITHTCIQHVTFVCNMFMCTVWNSVFLFF